MKTFKTALLLAALSGLLLFIGDRLVPGGGGLVVALGFAAVMNLGAWFFSDKIAIKMARAKPMEEADYPGVYRIVRRLSERAGKPMPRLYISPSPQLNAFATGRSPKHAAVCVNQGLYEALTDDELEGVLGHELQHVYNRDVLIGSVAATIAAAITMLARMAFWFGGGRDREGGAAAGLLMMILAPIAAMLIQAAVSRARESAADHTGAELTGNPLALASALRKLEQAHSNPAMARRGATPAETSAAFSHLYIAAPFGGRAMGSMAQLFTTHPPISKRVEALEEMARRSGQLGPDPYRG
ncbi:MAG: M48 family metalloprotease [Actinomycetota bacterium]|nr:M48 family metalloprotease [Actinomycetota bacterium]